MISRSDHPLSSIQHVAFRKKGKANFWPQRQERWDGRNVPEGSGPAVAMRAPTRDYKQGEGDPKTSPMPRAALWIRAAPAPCPLSPFLPNSHLTFILRPPKTRELPPFTMGWRVCLRAIPGHLMCVLHALLEMHRWKGYTGERRICWGCFCLRPPLRARACLGAGGRLFCSLARSLARGGVTNCGWGQEGRSEVSTKWGRWTWDTSPGETWSLSLRTGCPPSPVSVWALFNGMGRKCLSWRILK